MQTSLSLRLISALRSQGVLGDVITEYGIEGVRVCEHCGRLMDEGWMYHDCETYCSDECLIAAHPEENLEELKKHAGEDDSAAYWTRWEG